MGKRNLSKKELEEQRKREEEKAAAHVSLKIYMYISIPVYVYKFFQIKLITVIAGFSRVCGNIPRSSHEWKLKSLG